MRKILYSIIICIMLLTCSCDLNEFNKLVCTHEFDITEIPSTCSNHGKKVKVCKKCEGVFEEKLELLNHEFLDTIVQPTCVDDGKIIKTCKVCNKIEENIGDKALGHKYGATIIIKEATDIDDGAEKAICELCNYEKISIIPSINYVSLDLVRYNYPHKKSTEGTINISSKDELQLAYDSLLVNNIKKDTFKVGFEISDLNSLLSALTSNSSIPKNYRINASCIGEDLTFEFEFLDSPLYKTNNIAYSQVDSANISKEITNKRDPNFNKFKLNESIYIFDVTTSEQMLYYIERRINVNPVKDSEAYLVFEKAKEILRNIITDDMNDFQKIKAIHDYLIMNVTYDNELYQNLINGNTNLSSYRGFFLEGSIIDGISVCEGISKAFLLLCNIEGIPCVLVSGNSLETPNGVGHAWNKVFLDGKWYIVDVTSDGTILSKTEEVLSYEYFLISDEKMNERYAPRNYNNILCTSTYDSFSLFKYSYDNEEYNFVIKNIDDLKKIIMYSKSFNLEKITIQFKVAYECKITDEISKAFRDLEINKGFSYIEKDDIFMLIFS